jgi:ParB/RepB/Spo0J family partition protein
MRAQALSRGEWLASAARSKFGVCAICDRGRDTDGKPLQVARAERARMFRCFECTTNPPRKGKAVATKPKTPAPPTRESRLEIVSLAKLKAADENRAIGDVDELAQSIREHGIEQPIVAVQENGHFLIVAGARRAAAAKKAGLVEVEVIVREYTDFDRLVAMAVENLQRKDLTPLEEATAYERLLAQGVTQRDLAAKVGKSQGHISKRLALLKLPEDVRAEVDSGGITIADAVELSRLADHPEHLLAAVSRATGYYSMERAVAVEAELMAIDVEQTMVAREEELESQAIPTIRLTSSHELPKGVFQLKDSVFYYRSKALDITKAAHKKYGCHTIALRRNGPTVEEMAVCTNRKNHSEVKTLAELERAKTKASAGSTPTPGVSDQAKHDRVREQLEAAATTRRDFLKQLLGGKGLPKAELLEVIVEGYIQEAIEYGESNVDFAAIALGLVETDDDGVAIWPEGVRHSIVLGAYAIKGHLERLRLAAALRLGWAEESDFPTWNPGEHWSSAARTHLEFLARHGYELSPIEKQRLPQATEAA